MQEHWVPPPDPRLGGLVAGISGYAYEGLAPGVHVGMPGPALTLILPLEDPIVVSDGAAASRAWPALASGLFATPMQVHHDGSQHGVQVDLTPAGARALLGVPAGELAQTLVALDDLAPGLADAGRDGATLRARTRSVVEALVRRLAANGAPPPEVAHAWTEIHRTRGAVAVGALAAQVGWSTRHLGERFKDEYGLSPKTAGRLVRFDRARRMVAAGVPLAETATRCGYADQAHLNRDWQGFVGLSPTRWRAEDRLVFVQDRDRPEVAGCRS
ncbi:AraC family transcriptional regulator [Nocardioides mangrovicus]|uniref:AraC family transcriptional regulator n=1 Tax=Nocardioides mangrovicus TaxID=2478913 RepID=A0A3L8P2S8_9ACTN|nr:helix-turn-helix domain-containing protein [Nocardioides mangrovicus]RLV49272.1 AraC family transcriptional regulator [Nocardioides mangrovicus]